MKKTSKSSSNKKTPQSKKTSEEIPVEIIPSDIRHELFCQAYIKHKFNWTRAYMEVYWVDEATARTSGARMFANVHIAQRVEELSREYLSNAWMDAEWVLRKLREVVDRCMDWTPIYDKFWKPTWYWRFNELATLKALEMIGNFFRMFNNGSEGLPQIPQPTDEETKQIAQFISLHAQKHGLSKTTSGDTQ